MSGLTGAIPYVDASARSGKQTNTLMAVHKRDLQQGLLAVHIDGPVTCPSRGRAQSTGATGVP